MTTHETHWSPAVRALVERAKAEALREAADAWTQGAWSDVMLPKVPASANRVIAYSNRVGDWLRARADSLAAQPAPEAATVEEVARVVCESIIAGRVLGNTHTVWTDWQPEARAVLAAFDVRRKP